MDRQIERERYMRVDVRKKWFSPLRLADTLVFHLQLALFNHGAQNNLQEKDRCTKSKVDQNKTSAGKCSSASRVSPGRLSVQSMWLGAYIS